PLPRRRGRTASPAFSPPCGFISKLNARFTPECTWQIGIAGRPFDDFREIEVRFVNGHLLDHRAGLSDDAHDVLRFLAVASHPWRDKNSFRTKPPRRDAGHGGAHAKFSCFVTV